jgi:hypothetical protein
MKTSLLFLIPRIGIILMAFCVLACTRSLEKDDFIAWVEDPSHGLHQVRQKDDWIFDIQYLPLEYRKVKLGYLADSTYVDNEQLFLLKISSTIPNKDWLSNGLTTAEAQSLQYYFSYTFPNDINLEGGGVTYNCEMFHFEKSAQPGRPHIFHLGFNVDNLEKKTMTVVLSSDFFGSFPLRFRFSPETLPKLTVK